MASGFKEMVLNTQERIISTDHNRAQKFKGFDVAEIWRYLLDTASNDDLNSGGTLAEYSTTESPLRGEIVNGLLVQPQGGNFNLLVTAGVIFVIHPDSAADDSNYKYIHDPGVSTPGALTVTTNSSGSPRVDIVEVQDSSQVLETDNRDLFNATTGLFSASTVNKAVGSRLTYRVRAGTPGSGLPDAVSGWLQLAVILVPNGAASLDACTLWDVRPLISDRQYSPVAMGVDKPWTIRQEINAFTLTAVSGIVEYVAATGQYGYGPGLSGRRVGGRLRRGTPGTDADSIDFTSAANQESGWTPAANKPWYLYLIFPTDRRWARYTDGSSGRYPRSPRGIPIVSMTAPDNYGLAVVNLPSTVFGAVQSGVAYCVGAGYFNATTVMKGFWGDHVSGNILQCRTIVGGLGFPDEPLTQSGTLSVSTGDAIATFALTAGTHYPPNAKALLIDYHLEAATLGLSSGIELTTRLRVETPNGSTPMIEHYIDGRSDPDPAGVNTYDFRGRIWVELPTIYPTLTAPSQTIQLLIGNGGGLNAPTIGGMRILGWRLK